MSRKFCIGLLSIQMIVPGVVFGQANTSAPAAKQAASAPLRDVKVTYGPLVQVIGNTSAVISWSTNVTTDTALKYGTSADQLDQVARSPWSGTTHRIELKNLLPNTTYYYRVAVSNAQASEPMNTPAKFTTKTAGAPTVRP
jgi:phosphodiesterase/alkaline phosphatase D-like protein